MGALIDPPHYYMCLKCLKVMKSDILVSGDKLIRGSCPTCKQTVVHHKDCGGLCVRTEGGHISY